MLPERIGGVIFILLGLGLAIFARKAVDVSIRSDKSRYADPDRYPWLAPSSVWLIRIGAVFAVLIGLSLIF